MTGNANFNEVFFTDVRVPKHQIVGQRGQGCGCQRNPCQQNVARLRRQTVLFRLAVIKLMREETINGERVTDNPVFRPTLKLQGRVLAMQYNDMRYCQQTSTRIKTCVSRHEVLGT